MQSMYFIYLSSSILADWRTSTFAAVPKKPNAEAYQEHRLINLMNHVFKAFLKIIHKRIYGKCRESGDTWFDLRYARARIYIPVTKRCAIISFGINGILINLPVIICTGNRVSAKFISLSFSLPLYLSILI